LSAFGRVWRLSVKVVMDDRELLRQYVEHQSETAFTELVARHLNLVYATALRVVGDPEMAQDVAQAVFIHLARKASTIREGNALPGWLYRATCGLAKDAIRGERRRRKRESEAVSQVEVDIDSQSWEATWEAIAPWLEEAMQQLDQREQDAVVLRFLENKALAEVGRALQISEDAAQKRVSRALERLRAHLVRRRMRVSATTLATTLTIAASHTAPAGLVTAVASAALAAGSTTALSALTAIVATTVKPAIGLFILVGLLVAIILMRGGSNGIRSSGATFRGVGDLVGGQFLSYASAVSGDGTVVVGTSESANGNEAFRWALETGMIGLGGLSGARFSSSANAVSADGSIIVGRSSSSSGPQAFRWMQRTGMAGLGELPGGIFSSVAYGISATGELIVGESASARSDREAFRCTEDGMSGLGALLLERFNSHAMAASADGSVVIGTSARPGGHFEAFRWTQAGGMVGLGDFPGGVTNSNAYGISADARFVVGYGCPGTFNPYTHEAFRWTEESKLEHLGFAAGLRNSAAYAVSADGNVIVGDNKSERPAVALIWTPQNGMRRLQEVLTNEYKIDLIGWQLTSARGVSHDGKTIVGSGVNPAGQTEGWIVSLKTVAKGQP
jgi:RNA polymerase sigma factor (sigma-70 family)